MHPLREVTAVATEMQLSTRARHVPAAMTSDNHRHRQQVFSNAPPDNGTVCKPPPPPHLRQNPLSFGDAVCFNSFLCFCFRVCVRTRACVGDRLCACVCARARTDREDCTQLAGQRCKRATPVSAHSGGTRLPGTHTCRHGEAYSQLWHTDTQPQEASPVCTPTTRHVGVVEGTLKPAHSRHGARAHGARPRGGGGGGRLGTRTA